MTKVLVIEDDPLMSRMYEEIFTFEKYDVILASDGLQGLDLAKKSQPNVIMLDVMMPNMNGIEVLEKLKSDPATSSIPVIMLTNLASDEDVKSALLKGAVKYLIKSEYNPKEVTDLVKEVTAGSKDNISPEAKSS